MDWFLTSMREPVGRVVDQSPPACVPSPDRVIFPVVEYRQAALMFSPCATESTYCLLAISVLLVGSVVICPVTVLMLVKLPVEGEVPPITVESIVLLVIVTPSKNGLLGGRKGVPAGPMNVIRSKVGSGLNMPCTGTIFVV